MTTPRLMALSGLMSFTGGFVDVVCFFGLKGLLAAHITGNLATLCASVVLGTAGLVSKMLAVPEFVVIVAIAHIAGLLLRRRPAARILLAAEVPLLAAFLVLALRNGPFPDPDSPAALTTALAAIAAMAVQNAAQRAHLPDLPPTTFMTGNATQTGIDFAGLFARRRGLAPMQQARFSKIVLNLVCFGIGSAAAALTFWQVGFWAVTITLPTAIAAAALAP